MIHETQTAFIIKEKPDQMTGLLSTVKKSHCTKLNNNHRNSCFKA